MYTLSKYFNNFARWLSLLIVILPLLLPTVNVHARCISSLPLGEDDFSERKTKYFIILFPKAYESLADQLFRQYGNMLDEEYEKFQSVYGNVAIYPLTIRVYINKKQYQKLNPFAPPLKNGGTHSHVGTREIAIIGDAVAKDYFGWFAEATNAFRYELAILFAKQLSDQKAPEGLLRGIGTYFEDLATLEALIQQTKKMKIEAQSWKELFENDAGFFEPATVVQQASIVSYLVGIKDWKSFIAFLNRMKTSYNYQLAFKEIYQREQGELEKEWKSYLPLYISKDWRWNKLTNYNFKISEKLIAAGAFNAAYTELEKVLENSTALRQEDKKQTALNLMKKAQAGIEGNNNLSQGRLMLARGDYNEAILFFNKARESFSSIDYTQKNKEIEALLQRAKWNLTLQAEVKRYRSNMLLVLLNTNAIRRLKEIRAIYDQLDDENGVRTVDMLMMEIQQRQLWIFVSGAFLVVILLLLYRRKSRLPAPPEANL